jgi:hypothetical protein
MSKPKQKRDKLGQRKSYTADHVPNTKPLRSRIQRTVRKKRTGGVK